MNNKDHIWMVCVRCFTFNQKSYIEDALNGFTIQQTTFPYICTIVDDASTDGEPIVIRHYLEEHFDLDNHAVVRNEETDDYVLSFAQHKTNKNCYFAVLFLKYNHYRKKSKFPYIAEWHDNTKYNAICEGDDYWIDPLKLQKQFDFMEAHPECSLCFHAHKRLYPNGTIKEIVPEEIQTFYDTPYIILIKRSIIGTNTLFYCSKYLEEGYPDFWKQCPVGDLPLQLFFSAKGKIGFINEFMSVYRKNSIGSWSSRKTTLKSRIAHYRAVMKTFRQYDYYTQGVYHQIVKKKNIKLYEAIMRDILLTLIKTIIPQNILKKLKKNICS